MQKPKGIIMKLSGSHTIVMTSDRQFLLIPLQAGMRIGQEVELPKVPVRPSFGWRKIGLVAASLVLAIGVWQATSLFRPGKVSAYVAIDINPSLELAVDKEKDVLHATHLNSDGEKLIVSLKLKGKSIEKAVNELATEAAKQGYLKPDGEILVTASNAGASQLDIAVLEQDVMSSVQATLKQTGMTTNVGGVLVSESLREEAKSVGLSPGKYALYLQAQASGISVTVDDLKQQSVSNVAVQHGKDMKEIVHGMKGDKKLEELLKELQEKKASTSAKQDNDDKNKDDTGRSDDSSQSKDKKEHSNGNPPAVK